MGGLEGHILAAAVGNSRTRAGLFKGTELVESFAVANAELGGLAPAVRRLVEGTAGVLGVIASVNEPVAERVEAMLGDALSGEVYRIGRDLHVPMRHTLADPSTVGQDRLLCALAAYGRAGQACIVIDAGTAITVDFVDGEGVFHGGVIAPGVRMMLASLHEHTSALPKLDFAAPDPASGPFGKDTRHAMILGVQSAAQGLVRLLIDRYAEYYEAYPQVVATGGDAGLLFENDPVVEHIVPDLQLIGILEACRRDADEEGEFPGGAEA